ncbi:MAG: UvrB/UvrC motif-containing protein, partial [Candidatus Latescibacterota bacterium]
ETEQLKKELLSAIENEDFERAAELRDLIHQSDKNL